MNILPYHKLTFRTHKSAAAVALLLLRVVPPDGDRLPNKQRMELEYFGSIWEDSFTIVRNINYGNKYYPLVYRRDPFTPIYKGRLIDTAQGAMITIVTTPPPEIAIAALLTISFFGILIFNRSFIDTFFILLLGLLVALWLINWHVNSENRRLADFLRRTVEAKPIT